MNTTQIEMMTDAELAFAKRDLSEVIALQELMVRDGAPCPKLGQYWDELYAVMTEQRARALPVAA